MRPRSRFARFRLRGAHERRASNRSGSRNGRGHQRRADLGADKPRLQLAFNPVHGEISIPSAARKKPSTYQPAPNAGKTHLSLAPGVEAVKAGRSVYSVRSPTSSPRSPRPNAMARHALTRPSVEIKIQEDFHALGGDTLAMLETYVEGCDVVIHFIGDMAGSAPRAASVDDLLKRRPELAAQLGDKGLAREALGGFDLYPIGGMAHQSASTRTAPKRTSSLSRRPEGVQDGESFKPTDASRASQADTCAASGRPVLHQRRRSREAGPRFGGPRRADRGRHAAEDKTPQSPAAFAWAPVRRARQGS